MKKKYVKPKVVTGKSVEQAFPAALLATVGAIAAGVASGVGIRKLLEGRTFVQGKSLVSVKK